MTGGQPITGRFLVIHKAIDHQSNKIVRPIALGLIIRVNGRILLIASCKKFAMAIDW